VTGSGVSAAPPGPSASPPDPNAAAAGSPSVQRIGHKELFEDLDVPVLRRELAVRTKAALERMREAGVARTASQTLSGIRQTYAVRMQELGFAATARPV